ncbi:MAG TPA: right-handed parallel beta-helix repeat-containing protein [Chitinophagaceae bacterium]
MKFLLVLFFPLCVTARTFHVTPSMTLSQVNELPAKAGDSVVFQAGAVWQGRLVIKNGVHYCGSTSGLQPVITGMTDVTAWKNVNGNIWEAAGSSNVLTINGSYFPYGRTGWMTYESFNGNTITDDDLQGDWMGAELVMRKQPWVVDRARIIAQSGNDLTYVSLTGLTDEPVKNAHYFIQNSPGCLHEPGDWASGATKIDLCWNRLPAGVKIAKEPTLLEGAGRSGATIDRLSFIGSTETMVNIPGSSGLTFTNCSFAFCGEDAFYVTGATNLHIRDCSFETIANNGILGNASQSGITGSSFHRIGVYEGMTMQRNKSSISATAIRLAGDENTITGNSIVQVGYNAIDFKGDKVIISDNYIDSFCLAKADGGAIYTWNGERTPGVIYTQRSINGNIIQNGLHPADLDASLSNGIYIDDNSNHISVTNNFVYNCAFKNIYLHNAHEIEVRGNTSIGGGFSCFAISHGSGKDGVSNIMVMGNRFIGVRATAGHVISIETRTDSIPFIGHFDSNVISSVGREGPVVFLDVNGRYSHLDLSGWQRYSGFDKTSRPSRIKNLSGLKMNISRRRPFAARIDSDL